MMPLKDLDLGNLNELPFFFPVLRKRGHCFDVKNGLLLLEVYSKCGIFVWCFCIFLS